MFISHHKLDLARKNLLNNKVSEIRLYQRASSKDDFEAFTARDVLNQRRARNAGEFEFCDDNTKLQLGKARAQYDPKTRFVSRIFAKK